MPRYVAEGLDLSRMPKPRAVRSLDYETLLERRRVRLKAELAARDIPFDAARIDSEPAMALQQVDAYRELLGLAQVNAGVLATMLAWAVGTDLDNCALRLPLLRMDGESDERFRWRCLLIPESWGAGKLAGYLLAALTAHPDVADAGVWVDRTDPRQPIIRIAPIVSVASGWVDASDPAVPIKRLRPASDADGTPSDDVLEAVRILANRDDVAAASDVISVRPPRILPYQISLVTEHLRGPDPAALRTLSAEGCAAMADARRSPGRDVPLAAIIAAGQVPAAENVQLLSPTAPILASEGDLAVCTAIDVQSLVVNG
ncbi:hypothetical protein [Caulobacter segnis]|uniref:Baseplate protein J-like domain-containing protein n=1 Tax=Caulobacter segnis TaxID=88688 RepID=A0A2W5VFF5_9CAUL|nr:hypothetical protein [Caulobacter segnis]PZR37177.1 MAG: hypothetical protein DI526_01285 [Caulobacter segnis]